MLDLRTTLRTALANLRPVEGRLRELEARLDHIAELAADLLLVHGRVSLEDFTARYRENPPGDPDEGMNLAQESPAGRFLRQRLASIRRPDEA